MDVKQLLAKIVRKHGGDWLEKIPAITGNRAGVVDAGDGKIWVRIGKYVEREIINEQSALQPDIHILIGRLRSSPNTWRVAEVRQNYLRTTSPLLAPHHLQHELGGFDQVSIHRKQIISATAFVSDSENFLVRVFGGLFKTDSGWVLAESTDGTIAHPDLDLSAEVPATGAVYVGIEADSTGALSLNVGTPFASPELGTGADVPIPPDGSRLIAFVLLYDSQVELLDSDISVPGLFAGGSGGLGAAVWGAITGTLSDQADLQTALDGKIPTSYLDTDVTLAAESDSKIATQKATKAYTDNLIAGLWSDGAVHIHGFERFSGVAGQDTFDCIHVTQVVTSLTINGIKEDSLVYSLSLDGTQIILDTPLVIDSLVMAETLLEAI